MPMEGWYVQEGGDFSVPRLCLFHQFVPPSLTGLPGDVRRSERHHHG